MPEYRLYFLNRQARIARPAEILTCADDHEVIEKVQQLVNGESIEIWDGKRVVARLPREE